jgi:hypothetical protein
MGDHPRLFELPVLGLAADIEERQRAILFIRFSTLKVARRSDMIRALPASRTKDKAEPVR